MEEFDQADQGDFLDEMAWSVCSTGTVLNAFQVERAALMNVVQSLARSMTDMPSAQLTWQTPIAISIIRLSPA